MNETSVNAQYDMGRDNYQNASEYNHSTVSRDVFSFDLNYFNTDFRPIGTSTAQFRNPFYNYANETSLVGKQLFNGNIKSMSVALDQFGLNHYSYRYDQLNRLVEKRSFYDDFGLQEYNDFNESFTYDANGNILSAVKSASEGSPGGVNMDILGYQYLPGSNKLDYVTDQVSASAHANDVDGQLSNNYTYDNIGNLVSDVQENIVSISWTVYGKINSILKQNASTGKETNIQYQYDPSGNRVYKNVTLRNIGVTGQDVIDHTYYVRDAQGNVMSTYTKHEEPANNISLKWAEQHLYGSSRLGLMNLNLDVPAQPMVPASGQTLDDDLFTGQYVYELTNHLGNVMATISDKKLFSNAIIPDNGPPDFYYPEVLSETDYYAFGQEIKDRSYRLTGAYRYGFNGKENDDEIKGEGNQQDYGMRIYDPRLGRFLSRDPLGHKFAFYSPYQFSGNTPIKAIDLDGGEPVGNPWDWNVLYDKEYEGNVISGRAYIQKVKDKEGNAFWITKHTIIERELTYGISIPITNFYWYNEDPNLNAPKKSQERWSKFETDFQTRQKHAREFSDKFAEAYFNAAFNGTLLFAGGGMSGSNLLAINTKSVSFKMGLEWVGQFVFQGANWKKIDYGDVLFSGLLNPAGSATFGALIDWRPMSQEAFSFSGVNKKLSTTAIDFSFKIIFGGKGIGGKFQSELTTLPWSKPLSDCESEWIKNIISVPINFSGKSLRTITKEKTDK